MNCNALLTTPEAAEYLRLSFRTLNNSRYTGLLAGVKAPPYRKMGKAVRYELSALDTWKAQFSEQTSTSESAA
ncbi:helix-turn-helix domain-containing protein [Gilvimarinus sp. DA14]|uniref:helix-turn-helix domain-containing protein n=1 Tax=Gilvimarinus sp. DA14 TaxID=2956798 RepID=UPI0020B82036|nr:helix-turn-helix domain-containing protein [Gilvimarinus sp. DA14]UTF60275.1 helix-turn-helix domain-containing protein [Gilvimarinus sp. DA14]